MKLFRCVVGVAAGAALTAGGIIGATSLTANAYDPNVWDRVAACESTNRWDINTGNGFYGGLQFTKSTWLGFGGGEFAPYAHQATKAEQIAVARRVLAGQGPGAWPVCSQRAGLTKSTGGADRDARPGGATSKPAPPPAAPAPEKECSGGGQKVITVKAGDTLSALAARHNVSGGWRAIAKANNLSNPGYIRIGQRLVLSGCAGGAAPSGGGAESKPAAPRPATGQKVITVKAGDTLYRLAANHKVPGGWKAIADANDLNNPAYIRIGQRLVLPQR